jgi:hypothetical protein
VSGSIGDAPSGFANAPQRLSIDRSYRTDSGWAFHLGPFLRFNRADATSVSFFSYGFGVLKSKLGVRGSFVEKGAHEFAELGYGSSLGFNKSWLALKHMKHVS